MSHEPTYAYAGLSTSNDDEWGMKQNWKGPHVELRLICVAGSKVGSQNNNTKWYKLGQALNNLICQSFSKYVVKIHIGIRASLPDPGEIGLIKFKF